MESRKRHYESESEEEEADMSPETPLISGADPINELPDEVLLKIFCYLSSKDIIMTILLVSERFHRLSQDSKLLTEILKGPFWPVHNEKELKCETCGKAYDFWDSLEDHIRKYGKRCGKSYDKSYIEALKSYIKALKHPENLSSLVLKDCYIHDTLCIALQNNKKLCHLEISKIVMFTMKMRI